MPYWWHMQYRVLVRGQRFGTEPIFKPGVQREELKRMLKSALPAQQDGEQKQEPDSLLPSVQDQLVRSNTQHFHELRAHQAMQQLLSTVRALSPTRRNLALSTPSNFELLAASTSVEHAPPCSSRRCIRGGSSACTRLAVEKHIRRAC